MKIQCDVCERAEAAVLCCADEAALCWACDDKVHAANKLAGKHQRVPLLPNNPSSSQVPLCDICQEKAGYFFCLEDRALLCRHCDIGIHTASPYVSGHQRFLITGVKVALQHCPTNNTNGSSSNSNGTAASNSIGRSDSNKHTLSSSVAVDDLTSGKKWRPALAGPVMGEMGGFRPQWLWNEVILDSAELDQCYGFSEPGSSS